MCFAMRRSMQGAYLLAIMERERVIGPTRSTEHPVRPFGSPFDRLAKPQ